MGNNTGHLRVMKLSEWEPPEWEKFDVVKEKKTGKIKWLSSEEEGFRFMLENFPKEMIDPQYFKSMSFTGEYYIG